MYPSWQDQQYYYSSYIRFQNFHVMSEYMPFHVVSEYMPYLVQ